MGNYLTVADVLARMARTAPALYDDGGAVNETWLADDIAAVEAVMNAYLGRRYTVPVTADGAQALLRSLGLDLFLAQAYRRQPSGTVPEGLAAAAERARELLADLGSGELTLGTATPVSENASLAEAPVITGTRPRFTREQLRGW